MKRIIAAGAAIGLAVGAIAISTTDVPCTNPVAYGAVPDDGLSDTTATQAAIDATPAGGTVCWPAGDFDYSRAAPSAYNRFAAISTHKGLHFTGAGPALTRLNLVGDQGGKTTLLLAIDPSASGTLIDNLAVTSTRASNTDEQTHLIATTGVCSAALSTCNPIDGLTIRNIRCDHPRGDTRRGDCIRLLGDAPGTRVHNVLIENNHLSGARSGVELQRGLENVTIRNNLIDGPTADQHIDGEASGVSPGMEVKNVTITGNTTVCGPANQGDYDISMTSGQGIEVFGNRLCRGIKVVKSTGVRIHDERIWLTAAGVEGVIEASNVCTGLDIRRVTLVRDGMAGPLIRVVPHGTETCSGVTIEDNVGVQRTASFAVYGESSSDQKVRRNTFSWTAPAPDVTAVYSRGTINMVTGLEVQDNVVVGQLRAVVALVGAPKPISVPIMTGNVAGNLTVCTGTGCP